MGVIINVAPAATAITRAGVDVALELRVADLEHRVAAQHGAYVEALRPLEEELRVADEKLVKAREASERAEAELQEQQRQFREALQRMKHDGYDPDWRCTVQ